MLSNFLRLMKIDLYTLMLIFVRDFCVKFIKLVAFLQSIFLCVTQILVFLQQWNQVLPVSTNLFQML